MTLLAWELEWRLAARRRRLFALNTAIPLLLVVPVALAGAPPFHAAAVFAVLFVLFGTFGSTIPLVRDGTGGMLRRLLLAGLPPASFLLQRSGAAALIDLLQLLPSLAVILWAGEAGVRVWATALPVLLLTLMVANLVGAWVAAAARSLAEGALFAAVISLFLLHASGVFRVPEPGSLAARLQAVGPYGSLHGLLLDATGGGTGLGARAGFVALVAGTAFLIGVTALAARPILDRISAPAPG